ncbi:hypothetical protein COLO4_05637 [Corchorus olitorius]|uniref:Uncharacterized protein n=1 Tax=Corchorus olitorius TaxID=93759 RepID=A0A1R3KQ93_9ROSI|nr:hypothetical protein COLO4_05637 [Corchorus olitorius]
MIEDIRATNEYILTCLQSSGFNLPPCSNVPARTMESASNAPHASNANGPTKSFIPTTL